ncbi:MAG: hypothetical protein KDI09_21690, partial [Halioglobus sp.]|nr:hypothetical protein [Halioglobus sp.]
AGQWGFLASALVDNAGFELRNVKADLNTSSLGEPVMDGRADPRIYTADVWYPTIRYPSTVAFAEDSDALIPVYGEMQVCAKNARDRDAFDVLGRLRFDSIDLPTPDPDEPFEKGLDVIRDTFWDPMAFVLDRFTAAFPDSGSGIYDVCANIQNNLPSSLDLVVTGDVPTMYAITGPDVSHPAGQRFWMNELVTELGATAGENVAAVSSDASLQGFVGPALNAEQRRRFFLSPSANCFSDLCSGDVTYDPNQPSIIAFEDSVSDAARRQRLGWILHALAEQRLTALIHPGRRELRLAAAIEHTLRPLVNSLEIGGQPTGETGDEEFARLLRGERLIGLLTALDIDGDGILNEADAFPAVPLGGATDTDNDGAPNDCDAACQNAGMTADTDDDNDGIDDASDGFPLAVTRASAAGADITTTPQTLASTSRLANVRSMPFTPPPGFSGIAWQVSFSVLDLSTETAESVEVAIDFGAPLPAGAGVYKVGSGNSLARIPGATVLGSVVRYTLMDNGSLDANAALGIIDDPITVGSFSGPGSSVTPVPVMPAAWLALLSAMLLLAAKAAARQRRRALQP